MNDNLRIWSQVEKTDPAFTKSATVNGQKITSITTLWPIKKATEVWGPCGIGWGYEIIEDRFDQGAPIFQKNGDDSVEICKSVTHTILIKLWYTYEGSRGEVLSYGHTPYLYRSKYGVSEDTEAPKKSLSDALKKALSMLGFSADVFSGQFDDPNYVEATRTEYEIEKSDKRNDTYEKKVSEFRDWIMKERECYALIPNMVALERVYNRHWASVQSKSRVLGLDENEAFQPFFTAFEAQKNKIGNKPQEVK